MILFRFKFFYSFLVQLSILGTCLLFTITKLLLSVIHGGSKKLSNGQCCENVVKIMFRGMSTIALIYKVYS